MMAKLNHSETNLLSLDSSFKGAKFCHSGASISKEVCTSIISHEPTETSCKEDDCWLLKLPFEILEYIFSFLDPRSLINIKFLNIDRFCTVVSRQKSLDFSIYNDATISELSLLSTKKNGNHIKRINFNYMYLVNSYDLLHFILNFKYVTSLSIVGCGVNFKHFCSILCECKMLQEIAWDVHPNWECIQPLSEFSCGLKKLHLCMVPNDDNCILVTGIYIVKRCLIAKEIFLNFSDSLYPLLSVNKTFICKLHSDSKCPTKVALQEDCLSILDNLRHEVACCNCDQDLDLTLTINHPFLQLLATSKDCFVPTSIADESVQKLMCIVSDNYILDQISSIKRITGKALTYLCLKNYKYYNMTGEVVNVSLNTEMHQIVPKLIINCEYLKELILTQVHFDYSFDLKVLCNIKALNTLLIPACMLKAECSDEIQNLKQNFNNFVMQAKDIQHFAINGCNSCRHGPKDDDIASISEWSGLRTLSLIDIPSLSFCHFLRQIADKCIHLRSVDVQKIGESEMFDYLSSIAYLVEKSPQLIFLRTNLDIMFGASKDFWQSIELAKNLQGLCLYSQFASLTTPTLIVNTVTKLKNLQIFHFRTYVPFTNLEGRVRKAMKRNGVKNPEVCVNKPPVTEGSSDKPFNFCHQHHFLPLI